MSTRIRTSRRTPLAVATAIAIGSTLLAACSSSSSTTTTGPAAALAWMPPTCHRPVASAVVATPVAGIPSDWTVTSFDGTKIRAHWFPVAAAGPSHTAPTVLMGPGWSLSGDTDTTGTGSAIFGGVDISTMHADGYNVLTWDPRGFGASGGLAEVDSPTVEARDVSRLVDWVATLPGVELDRPGDPRMAMIGGSYGGGIQWVTAARDCRIDAIVPSISWHSLATSLGKTGLYKAGWGNLLLASAAGDGLDPTIRASATRSNANGAVAPEDLAWFASKGPDFLLKDVDVPTLIVQGTADTLFTLDEGIANYRALRQRGVPVSMLWFCGGHGVCLTSQGDPLDVQRATMAWLDRWVKRDTSVSTGPTIDLIDQNGVRYASGSYPLPTTSPIVAEGSGNLPLVASGGSGPVHLAPGAPGTTSPLAAVASSILPARASNAVDVPVAAPANPALVVGAPTLTLAYRGTVAAGARPTRVFAQLVDETTGQVIGSQVTPVPVVLDGKEHTTDVSLETIAEALGPGHRLTLQLVATTVAYATPRLGGSVTFDSIHLALPVVRSSSVTVIGSA